eukprot:GEMP01037243.1.p1 GENE.GEMP01037243.1~~GEMP01037243.1.p1  ORF type:complete len:316 (+),score=89.57 GEMP01037243.1:148-1095(+)
MLSRVASVLRSRSFATLVIADHDSSGQLAKATYHAVSAAKNWEKGTVSLLVTDKAGAKEAAGLGNVYVAECKTVDALCDAIEKLHAKEKFTHVCGPASSVPRDVLPRFAAKIDVQPISEIISVVDDKTFKRPMYAGNAIATVRSSDPVKVLTIRTTAFPPAEPSGEGKVENLDVSDGTIKWVADSGKTDDDRPKLGSAKRVVSGGRGLASGENFEKVLQPLCDALGAAMGASRAAVDAGYVPNELQVGQTGKVVAPDLYIAVGISGAIQHLAGMKDSKTIVAINKDADAPIFAVADYGLAADLFVAVPELVSKVK